MLLIKKNSPPKKFVTYAQHEGARFDDMPSDVKNILRHALLEEQGYVCAYCMRRIGVDEKGNNVKIEHYCARTSSNELDYNNLLAVCKGNEGEPKSKQSCDTHKGNQVLHIDPQRQRDIATIHYKRNGFIESSNTEFKKDLDDVLNLNAQEGYLISNRRKALANFLNNISKKLGKRSATHEDWQKFAKIVKDDNGKYISYAGIVLWYINGKLGKTSKRCAQKKLIDKR